MNIHLFRLALERLQPSDWEHFERLCSQFLIPDYNNLRTMAHPSGDGGRDSELFSPENQPIIAAQYSIAKDWKSKILQTAKRLSTEHPEVKILIYMSNLQIGGQADTTKKEILEKYGLNLDLRDRNWFIERPETDPIRGNAANELIERIARPYLVGEDVINKPTSPLTSNEAKAALVYLGLQWQDDITEKGLTKLSFDALVRAALRHTYSENRLSRQQVYDAITTALPSAQKEPLIHQVDKALNRLKKRYIRHWQKEDEFCLTHDERLRIQARLADKENQESDFINNVEEQCFNCVCELNEGKESDIVDLTARIPRILEQLFLHRGESFVSDVLTDNLNRVDYDQLADIVLNDISNNQPNSKITEHYPDLIKTVLLSVLGESNISTTLYLRRLANSYTLLSFLNETPDIQSATNKLFSHGTVWFDTTVLLPLFAEQLEEDDTAKRFTKVFNYCRDIGMKLRVTSGVLQEINAHMNNALSCSRYQPGLWQGQTPYLYYQFLHTGQSPSEFNKWLSLFRGTERPEEDLAQYLSEVFDIERQDLEDAALRISDDLRFAADRLWTEAHKSRRKTSNKDDDITTRKLIQHDVETYLGVVALRQEEDVTELGYRHWLLTFDKNAWKIRDKLKEEFINETPPSPLMSLSFLLNNMTFGPSRTQINKENSLTLPLILDIEMTESLPHDIIEIADKVRSENEGLPDYVIKRKVRDAIDKARRRHGCLGFNNAIDSEEAEKACQPKDTSP